MYTNPICVDYFQDQTRHRTRKPNPLAVDKVDPSGVEQQIVTQTYQLRSLRRQVYGPVENREALTPIYEHKGLLKKVDKHFNLKTYFCSYSISVQNARNDENQVESKI